MIAQSVEHAAVNRSVVGSSPTQGVRHEREAEVAGGAEERGPHGQAVKTSPFHGGNTSSNLVGVIETRNHQVYFGPLAQLVRATGS